MLACVDETLHLCKCDRREAGGHLCFDVLVDLPITEVEKPLKMADNVVEICLSRDARGKPRHDLCGEDTCTERLNLFKQTDEMVQ